MKLAINPLRLLQTALICVMLASTVQVSAADNPVQNVTVQQVVDINSADAAELAEVLDGVGMAKAQAIIDYREQFGKFQSLEQLLDVKGIGEATLEKNRHRLAAIREGAE